MLKALYDYAVQNQLTLPAGYVPKKVKAYLSLTAEGQFVGIELTDSKEEIPCPDIGTLANGTEKSNVLVEKCSVVLAEEPTKKSAFFLQTLQSAAQVEPVLTACVTALTQEETVAQMAAEAERHKLKKSDRISFRVAGVSILDLPGILSWWKTFRLQFQKDGKQQARCLITGALTMPMTTVPPVQGLAVVGGHASGDTLICFDKAAFCSYGLKQAANAPVSEEAMGAVKAGLDDLLKKAPILAGMKFVHWYDRPIAETEDGLHTLTAGIQFEQEKENTEPEPEEDAGEQAISAVQTADRLVQSASSGEQPMLPPHEYYILLLSGAGGRIVVRRYVQGSYVELQDHLKQWWDDLELTNQKGTGREKQHKLTAMLLRLLSRQKMDSKPFRRLDKELSGLTPAILTAILTGGPLPNAVTERALAYIRSQMVDVDEDVKTPPVPDGMCCQWLKAWLLRENRRNHREEMEMVYYNANHEESAYHCGALVALYAEIQRIALPGVNAGVVQRYYAAASQSPALVLGQLARLSNYHLGKFSSPGLARMYEDKLNTVATAIGDRIPSTLTLSQQAYFALGYRHLCAELNRERAENYAKKMDTQNAADQEG